VGSLYSKGGICGGIPGETKAQPPGPGFGRQLPSVQNSSGLVRLGWVIEVG